MEEVLVVSQVLKQVNALRTGIEFVEVADKHEVAEEGCQVHKVAVSSPGAPRTLLSTGAGEQALHPVGCEEEQAEYGDEGSIHQNGRPHVSGDQGRVLGDGLLPHVAVERRLSCKGEGRQGVHHDVDPQQLGHRQRQVGPEEGGQEGH